MPPMMSNDRRGEVEHHSTKKCKQAEHHTIPVKVYAAKFTFVPWPLLRRPTQNARSHPAAVAKLLYKSHDRPALCDSAAGEVHTVRWSQRRLRRIAPLVPDATTSENWGRHRSSYRQRGFRLFLCPAAVKRSAPQSLPRRLHRVPAMRYRTRNLPVRLRAAPNSTQLS